MTRPAAAPSRAVLDPAVALVAVIGVLAAWNVARSLWVPSAWHLVLNVTVGLGTVGLAWSAGARAGPLGLSRRAVPSGLRLGGVASLVVATVVLVVGSLGGLSDDRVDASAGEMVVKVLLVIPLGTVLAEELAFRSALHGLLSSVSSSPVAVVAVGAVLFGLWHVVPAYRGGGAGTDVVDVGPAGAALGTFVATTIAGLAFLWLRQRSGSVVAPLLAHLATNSVTFAVAWLFR